MQGPLRYPERGEPIVVAAGVVFAAAGLVAISRVWWVRHGGVQVQGVVVDPGAKWSGPEGDGISVSAGSRYYRPVVQFTPAHGGPVQFRSLFGTFVRYQPGRRVPVRYRASRPGIAVIDTFIQAWLVPIGFLIVGVGALVTALG
jgi:uncharacterized protein DUF3592